MNRAIINIPENVVLTLDTIAKERKLSRSALVRLAVETWIQTQESARTEAFGILKNTSSIVDGVTLQRKIRTEW